MWANIHNRNQTGYFSHVGEYTHLLAITS